jgi:phosphotransferase system  glucose/maltose/N-acetylglucosamine-specific IIC component
MVFATNGCGMLVGHFLSGRVHDHFMVAEGQHNWAMIFIVPIVVTVVAAVAFISLFNERQFQVDAAKRAADEGVPLPGEVAFGGEQAETPVADES